MPGRRAAIYAARNPHAGDQIAARSSNEKAWFEAGYFIEAVRELATVDGHPAPPYIASLLAQQR